jgi:hypothetical protein
VNGGAFAVLSVAAILPTQQENQEGRRIMRGTRGSAQNLAKSACAAIGLAWALTAPVPAMAAGGWAWAPNPSMDSYSAPPNYSFNSSGGAIVISRYTQGLYTVLFEGLSVGAGNAQVTAYGAGNEYCNLMSWGSNAVNVACFAQGGAPVDTRFVVSLTDQPAVAQHPAGVSRGIAYVWKDWSDQISPIYSWNSTGNPNTLRKIGTGQHEVTLGGLGLRSLSGGRLEGPTGKPLVTAYGVAGGYCVAREASVVRPAAVVNVGCFDATGNFADMPFSLIVSKSRHMEGATFGQFWWTNQESSAFAMINGGHASNHSAGEITQYGKIFTHLIPEAVSSTQVSSCGPKDVAGFPGPQRCKVESWIGANPDGGVVVTTRCFDRFGGYAGFQSCYNAAYSTNQTAIVGTDPTSAELFGVGVTASTNDSNVPANTTDNKLATRWSGNGDGAWIRYDLGSRRLITGAKVAVFQGVDRWNHFDMQVSDDATQWTTVSTFASNTGTTSAEESYDLPDIRARYLRYLGHGATLRAGGTTPWNSVTEVSPFVVVP